MEGPRIITQLVAGNQELAKEVAEQMRQQGHADPDGIVRDLFACLLCKQRFPDRVMVLPAVLELAWRAAVLQTRDYAKLCSNMGGLFIHHYRGALDGKREYMLELIKTHFELFNGTLSTTGAHWALPAEPTPVVAAGASGNTLPRHGEYVTIILEDGKGNTSSFNIILDGVTEVIQIQERIARVTGLQSTEQRLWFGRRMLYGYDRIYTVGIVHGSILRLDRIYVRQ